MKILMYVLVLIGFLAMLVVGVNLNSGSLIFGGILLFIHLTCLFFWSSRRAKGDWFLLLLGSVTSVVFWFSAESLIQVMFVVPAVLVVFTVGIAMKRAFARRDAAAEAEAQVKFEAQKAEDIAKYEPTDGFDKVVDAENDRIRLGRQPGAFPAGE